MLTFVNGYGKLPCFAPIRQHFKVLPEGNFVVIAVVVIYDGTAFYILHGHLFVFFNVLYWVVYFFAYSSHLSPSVKRLAVETI